jgi:hypothetical protein
MENLNLELILLAVLGMIIHVLMKVSERADKKQNKFSLKVFFSDSMNWVRILLSLTSVLALMIMADDVADVMGITLSDGAPAKEIFAFGAGYLNHSLIRNLLKMFKKGSGETPEN